jgi:hypothetical protein
LPTVAGNRDQLTQSGLELLFTRPLEALLQDLKDLGFRADR